MQAPIYLDNHATTPVDERVLKRMLPYFREKFGNAASRQHAWGWRAEEAVEHARSQVAALIGGTPREVIFTSGATEANNLAILGAARAYASKGRHIVTQATEHKAVLDPCRVLEKQGYSLTVLDVDRTGCVDPEQLRAALRPETTLVSIMFANNEIGTLQPLADIGGICREHGAVFHVDAAQGQATNAVDVQAMQIDMLSVSAHKMYGPQGVGALYVRRRNPRVRLQPIIHGGGHERGWRSGTLNVPGIVGLGAAADLARSERQAEATRIATLRDQLWTHLRTQLEDIHVNGPSTQQRMPGNLHVSVAGVEGEALLLDLRDLAISSGAACTTASLEPSHVMRAIGLPDELASSSVRFGLGRFTTAEDIERAADRFVTSVQKLRARGPKGRGTARQAAG